MGEFPSKKDQFKPGQSGNPGGRPGGILGVLHGVLREKPEVVQQIVQSWIAMACQADKDALGHLKLLLDRVEGPVKQQLEEGGMPTEVIVVDAKTAKKYRERQMLEEGREEQGGGEDLPDDQVSSNGSTRSKDE